MKNRYFILFCGIMLIGASIFIGYIYENVQEDKKGNTSSNTNGVTENYLGSTAYEENVESLMPKDVSNRTQKILFVGNSLICNNDLPAVFFNLVEEMGDSSEVYIITKGASSLKDFANTKNDLGSSLDTVLKEESWDYVILQENTRYVTSNTMREDTLPYLVELDKKIRKSGAVTALFMTWAPNNGILTNSSNIGIKQVQKIISNNYHELADEVEGLLLPIGDAFIECIKKYPNIELWEKDKSHASKEGVYLAACVIYTSIFQKSLEECNYIALLEESVAKKLQTLASDIVLQQ